VLNIENMHQMLSTVSSASSP